MRNELSIHDFLLHLKELFLFKNKNKIKFSYESHLNIFIIRIRCSVFLFYFIGREQVSRGHGERRIYPSRECPRLCEGDFPKSKNIKTTGKICLAAQHYACFHLLFYFECNLIKISKKIVFMLFFRDMRWRYRRFSKPLSSLPWERTNRGCSSLRSRLDSLRWAALHSDQGWTRSGELLFTQIKAGLAQVSCSPLRSRLDSLRWVVVHSDQGWPRSGELLSTQIKAGLTQVSCSTLRSRMY